MLDEQGYLTITGRLKEIINRGGEKISPREVEEVLLAHPGVAQAVAFAVPHPTMGEDVAAAVVGAEGSDLDADDVRTFVAAQLSPYKVPQRIVVRQELPVGPTGKLQRIGMAERLGLHEVRSPASDGRIDAPASSLEDAVAAVWAGLLNLDRIGRNDRFVELGGDSLTAVSLVAEIGEAFGVDLPLTSALQAGATVATMALLIAEARTQRGSRRYELALDSSSLAVSFVQERFWVLHQLDPASKAYNLPLALRLRGSLDTDTLVRSLSEITRRHEALRSSFPAPDGRPAIVVHPPAPFSLRLVDVSNAADPLDVALSAAATSDVTARFDLDEGPVVRGSVYRVGPDDHLLVIVTHHIATDGWSRGVFRRELSTLYGALAAGEPSPLPDVEFGYPAWAAAQRRQLGVRCPRPRARVLAGAARSHAATGVDPERSPSPYGARSARSAESSVSVDGALRASLANLARSSDATLFMTLLAGFVGVLWHHTGLDDIVVGIPVAGRVDARSAEVIGPFLNTLPIRVAVDAEASFDVLLGRVRRACLEAYEHQRVPFERMIEQTSVARAPDHAPIVQVLFQLRNLPSPPHRIGPMTVEDVELHTGSAKFDLSIEIDDDGDGLTVRFEYATALFDASTIERIGRRLRRLLEAVSLDPTSAIGAVDLLDDAERATLSQVATQADTADVGWTVPDRIAAVAASRPTCVAARTSEGSLSYGDLLSRADDLARRLPNGGAADTTFVGVCVPRTLDLPVAILGVLRAGFALVPLDPSLPPARLAAVMERAGVSAVVTVNALAPVLPPSTTLVRIDDEGTSRPQDPRALTPVSDTRSVAYAMATSGSTGTPKCVLIEHGSLANSLSGLATRLGLDESVRTLAATPISFDPSLRELLLPLVLGGEVIITSNPMGVDPIGAAADVRAHEPSVVQGTPTTLRLLLGEGWSPAPSATVLSCGERLHDATHKATAGDGCAIVEPVRPDGEHAVCGGARGARLARPDPGRSAAARRDRRGCRRRPRVRVDGSSRRDPHRRRWRGARLRRHRPGRRRLRHPGTRASLSHRRRRSMAQRWQPRVSRPQRRPTEDQRCPD